MLDACLLRVFALSTVFYDVTDTAIRHLKRKVSNPSVAHWKRDLLSFKSRFQMPAKNAKKLYPSACIRTSQSDIKNGTEQASQHTLWNLISGFVQKYKHPGFSVYLCNSVISSESQYVHE